MDFVLQNLPVLGTACANHTGAATTSDLVSFRDYEGCAIVITCAAWAAGTAAVTVKQDTTTTPAGDIKALTLVDQWTNVADTTSPVFVRTAITSSTFDLSAADAIHVIDVRSEDLDADGGFHALRVDIASPGSNNDFYGVQFIMYNPRYATASMPDPTDNA